jgi:peptidyl-prolyl cis-trans isomerase D
VKPPDETDTDVAALHRQLSQQAASGQAQDLLQYFINDVQSRVGLQLDQQAIDAVNANF